MSIITIRDIILLLGWPVLIFGSIFIFRQSYRFKREIEENNPFGQLLSVFTVGIIITMYSLGVVATLAMFVVPAETVPSIIPIFIVWFMLMFAVMVRMRGLDKKTRIYNRYTHELERAKSEFVAIASHQLRTPLTGIKWLLEGIKSDKKFPASYLPDVKKMYLNNESMIQLISNILNNTRIETGQLVVNKEHFDLKNLIQEVVDLLSTNSLAKDQKIVFEMNPRDNTETYVDRMLFEESLKNFVSNAITYGAPNSVISIKLLAEPDMFTISIHNFGNPIPLEQRKKIFTKFSRHVPAGNQIVPDIEVGGIGLFIAKTFIDLNGGTVWYDSLEEKGTTFFFSLPRIKTVSK